MRKFHFEAPRERHNKSDINAATSTDEKTAPTMASAKQDITVLTAIECRLLVKMDKYYCILLSLPLNYIAHFGSYDAANAALLPCRPWIQLTNDDSVLYRLMD